MARDGRTGRARRGPRSALASRSEGPTAAQLLDEATAIVQRLGARSLSDAIDDARRHLQRLDSTPVRIVTLGGFRVFHDGEPIPPTAWQSRKARDLLKLLVSRLGRPIPHEQVCEVLWPDEPADRRSSRLSVTLSTLRGVLDPPAPTMQTSSCRPTVTTCRSTSTTSSSTSLGSSATPSGRCRRRRRRSRRSQPPRTAIRASSSTTIRTPTGPSAHARRRGAVPPGRPAPRGAARRRGELERAGHLYLRLLQRDPYDEAAHLALVRVLDRAGHRGEARRAYRTYSARMDELDVEPPPIRPDADGPSASVPGQGTRRADLNNSEGDPKAAVHSRGVETFVVRIWQPADDESEAGLHGTVEYVRSATACLLRSGRADDDHRIGVGGSPAVGGRPPVPGGNRPVTHRGGGWAHLGGRWAPIPPAFGDGTRTVWTMDPEAVTLEASGSHHAVIAGLREHGPVCWVPALGAWMVIGREVAVEVMRDTERFTVDDPRFSTARVVGPSMLSLDGQQHRRHRSPFVAAFRPSAVTETYGPRIEAEARRLVDRIAPRTLPISPPRWLRRSPPSPRWWRSVWNRSAPSTARLVPADRRRHRAGFARDRG